MDLMVRDRSVCSHLWDFAACWPQGPAGPVIATCGMYPIALGSRPVLFNYGGLGMKTFLGLCTATVGLVILTHPTDFSSGPALMVAFLGGIGLFAAGVSNVLEEWI